MLAPLRRGELPKTRAPGTRPQRTPPASALRRTMVAVVPPRTHLRETGLSLDVTPRSRLAGMRPQRSGPPRMRLPAAGPPMTDLASRGLPSAGQLRTGLVSNGLPSAGQLRTGLLTDVLSSVSTRARRGRSSFRHAARCWRLAKRSLARSAARGASNTCRQRPEVRRRRGDRRALAGGGQRGRRLRTGLAPNPLTSTCEWAPSALRQPPGAQRRAQAWLLAAMRSAGARSSLQAVLAMGRLRLRLSAPAAVNRARRLAPAVTPRRRFGASRALPRGGMGPPRLWGPPGSCVGEDPLPPGRWRRPRAAMRRRRWQALARWAPPPTRSGSGHLLGGRRATSCCPRPTKPRTIRR